MAKIYGPKHKQIVENFIRACIKKGMTRREILEKINESEIQTASGRPWTFGGLAAFINRMIKTGKKGIRQRKKRRDAKYKTRTGRVINKPAAINKPKIPVTPVVSILTDPTLNDGQVRRMLLAYYNIRTS